MRKISALLVVTALSLAPAGLAFAQSNANASGKTVLGVSTGTDKEGKARSETTVTGRGNVDPTGKPSGVNANSAGATTGSQVRSGAGTAIGRGNVDPTGKPSTNVMGNADARGSGMTISRTRADASGKTGVRVSRSKIEAYERAKVAALNMPQTTQAERDARNAAIARADAMRM